MNSEFLSDVIKSNLLNNLEPELRLAFLTLRPKFLSDNVTHHLLKFHVLFRIIKPHLGNLLDEGLSESYRNLPIVNWDVGYRVF